MSALALYYRFKGKEVRGYDRTPSDITEMLSQKDIAITFSEDLDFIPKDYTPENTLVVYTPAIPKEHKQLVYFQTHGYKVCKRSEVLGLITEDQFLLGSSWYPWQDNHQQHFSPYLGGVQSAC